MNKLNYAYEITDIAHPKFPQLHRIKALVDIDSDVHAGDLGGYVESYENLGNTLPIGSTRAWIYDDAICCNSGYVTQNGKMRDNAIVCGRALVSGSATALGNAVIEDYATAVAGTVSGHARLSGNAQVMGRIGGRVEVGGKSVIMPGQEINNPTENIILVDSEANKIRYTHSAPDFTTHEKSSKNRTNERKYR